MSADLRDAYVMPSGKTIVLGFFDGGQESPVASVGAIMPTIRINYDTQVTLTDPIWAAVTAGNEIWRQCWVSYHTPTAITSGQSVSVSFGASTFGFPGGFAPAVTNFACVNLAGGEVFSDLPESRHVKVGYNILRPNYSDPINPYANIALGGDEIFTNYGAWGPIQLQVNSDGYPTVAFDQAVGRIIQYTLGDERAPRGFRLGGFGKYRLMWDGDGDVTLHVSSARGGCTLQAGQSSIGSLVSSSLTGTADNVRIYDFPSGREMITATGLEPLSPYIRVMLSPQASAGVHVSNVRVYPPDCLDAGGAFLAGQPALFRPHVAGIMADAKTVRSMRWFLANTWSTSSHLGSATQMAFPPRYARGRAHITSMAAITSGAAAYNRYPSTSQRRGPFTRITTATPHGLSSGELLFTENGAGAAVYDYTVSTGSGSSVIAMTGGNVVVEDAYTFIYCQYVENGEPYTPVTNPNLYVAPFAGLVPPSHFFELANLGASDCRAWINFSHGANQSAVEAVATEAASVLDVGHPVTIEYCNEPWNGPLTTSSSPWWQLQAEILWGEPASATLGIYYYVVRAEQIRKWFNDKWVALGRTEDVNLVLGAWTTLSGWTEGLLTAAATYDYAGRTSAHPAWAGPCLSHATDCLAVAPYFDGLVTANLIPDNLAEGLTAERHQDLMDAYFLYPDTRLWYNGLKQHIDMVAASSHPNKANIKLMGYEGGMSYLGIRDDGEIDQDKINSRAAMWHPRFKRRYWRFLSLLDDPSHKLECFNIYTLWDGFTNEIGASGVFLPKNYGPIKGVDMAVGPGDGSLGLDNTAATVGGDGISIDPDLSLLESVVAYAVKLWNGGTSLTPPPASPSPGPAKRILSTLRQRWRRRI